VSFFFSGYILARSNEHHLTVGPIVGGQIYDNVNKGWMAICILTIGILLLDFMLSFAFIGNQPLLKRLIAKIIARAHGRAELALPARVEVSAA
jgi:hypothetical protein